MWCRRGVEYPPPGGPLSQLAGSPSDTEGSLWVPLPTLLTEVSSFFN